MASEYGEILEACRKKFCLPPRNFDKNEIKSFQLSVGWIRQFFLRINSDQIMSIIRDQKLLRDEGRVVWGCLVQANSLLFNRENTTCCPANVIYSLDPIFDDNPERLFAIAKSITSMKGKPQQDWEMDRVSKAVTDELKREMKLKLPDSMCDKRQVYFTTTLIQPAQLPGNHIADSLFPVVILPAKTESIIILPSLFWDESLIELWS